MLIDHTVKPNSFAKVAYITVTSLLKLKRANTRSSAEPIWVIPPWKAIRYKIHVISSHSIVLTKIVFSLFFVTNVKVVKTNTSFLAFFQDICWHNDLFAYNCSTQY